MNDGRIPFALHIGVTGHRTLPDTEALLPAVRRGLALIRAMVPHARDTAIRTVVVSSLAEGADRLVVHEVIRDPDSRLEVALPLPPDEYMNDFATEDSKREFEHLLEHATEVWQVAVASARDEAYERAGRYVVDRADAVIALWDGEPPHGRGGTAEIVAYADEHAVPLVWVHTKPPHGVENRLRTPRAATIAEAARDMQAFNSRRIAAKRLASAGAQQRRYWGVAAALSGNDRAAMPREDIASRLLPCFVRADLQAVRAQRVFNLLSAAVFVMAATATAASAVSTFFLTSTTALTWFEVAVLVTLIAIPWVSRRFQLHDRWIASRFFAERVRSVYFLTLAGTGDRRERSARLAYFADSEDLWVQRALEEVSRGLPRVQLDATSIAPLRDYLGRFWIAEQVRYHERTSRADRTRELAFVFATAVLFAVTLVAALLHALGAEGRLGPLELAALLAVISLSVPAIGAAVHGVSTQRQFRRHSERYRRMVRLLHQLHHEMVHAETLEDIAAIAADTERVMREENSDWFGVMRFHDMELIT